MKLLGPCAVISYCAFTSIGYTATAILETEGGELTELGAITDHVGFSLALTRSGVGTATVSTAQNNATMSTSIRVDTGVEFQFSASSIPAAVPTQASYLVTAGSNYLVTAANFSSFEFVDSAHSGYVDNFTNFGTNYASLVADSATLNDTVITAVVANPATGGAAPIFTLNGGAAAPQGSAINIGTSIVLGATNSTLDASGATGGFTVSSALALGSNNLNIAGGSTAKPVILGGANTASTGSSITVKPNSALSLAAATALGGTGTSPTVGSIALTSGSKLSVGVSQTLPPLIFA